MPANGGIAFYVFQVASPLIPVFWILWIVLRPVSVCQSTHSHVLNFVDRFVRVSSCQPTYFNLLSFVDSILRVSSGQLTYSSVLNFVDWTLRVSSGQPAYSNIA